MRKIIGFIFGPNGAGKGTLAENLKSKLDYYHMDSSHFLREYLVASNDQESMDRMDNGEFVDDDVLEASMRHAFEKTGHNKKLILDGIPRKKSQMKMIEDLCIQYNFTPLWMIVLSAPLDVLIERLKDRVVAPDGKNYHMTLNPPPKHFKLSELKSRPDDKPEIASKRYEYYNMNTLECLSDKFFINTNVHVIDATKSIPDVFEEGVNFVSEAEAHMNIEK
jgi:adenylate kinase